jgi:CMP-N,N'-diacetyllegionaminic acid synthase
MTWNGRRVLAVVPARGGSKGIPGKNLRTVNGLLLIARAAVACQQSPWIDRAIVSTDDDTIAAEAESHGLVAPFRRPDNLSGDSASTIDAWRHAWETCEHLDGCRYELGLLLEPTSPMRRSEDIERCLDALTDPAYDAAATVSPTPAHYTPHKTLTRTERGCIGFYHADGTRYANRHLIPEFYHRNGLCYAVRRATVMERASIVERNCAAVVVERTVVNIDEPFNLELAEFLISREPLHDPLHEAPVEAEPPLLRAAG